LQKFAESTVFRDIENLDVLLLGHFIAWHRSGEFLVLALYFKSPYLVVYEVRSQTP